MGRDRIQQRTPDDPSLAEGIGGQRTDAGSDEAPLLPSPKTILPKDLSKAIGYLDDQELDRLMGAAIAEARRRGRVPSLLEASSAKRGVSSTEPMTTPPQPKNGPSRRRQVQVAPRALTRGQINAVQAAFKAGITPSRIARQFGLTQSDVRKALAENKM